MPGIRTWLPDGKHAAVVLTFDDVHPGTSEDPYEAGGDLGSGALGHLERLLVAHPDLRATLFITPDWREISPVPTRRILARIPVFRDRFFLAPIHPKGTMRLDRHAAFAAYVGGLPRTELALHGLAHVHRGPRLAVEFQEQSATECEAMLREAMQVFADAGLKPPVGMTPPSWNAPVQLLDAMEVAGLAYVASACDIQSPVDLLAVNIGSGLRDVPVFRPTLLPGRRLVHIPANYRATSTWDRAAAIIEAGGLLSIKGHIIKDALGFIALDGLDEEYATHLDDLVSRVGDAFGDAVWWTSMDEVAESVLASAEQNV